MGAKDQAGCADTMHRLLASAMSSTTASDRGNSSSSSPHRLKTLLEAIFKGGAGKVGFECRVCSDEGAEKNAAAFLEQPLASTQRSVLTVDNPSASLRGFPTPFRASVQQQSSSGGGSGSHASKQAGSVVNIVLCSNRLLSESRYEETLLHEAVHAYDNAEGRYDFYSCPGVAATEIRAVREAECAQDKSVLYRLFPEVGGSGANIFREDCIKKLASKNAANRRDVCRSHSAAYRTVSEVYESAVRDVAPFELAARRPGEQ